MDIVKVGLLGFGSIGQEIVAGWPTMPAHVRLASICVRPRQVGSARELAGPDIAVTTSVEALLASGPTIVIEAAGQDGARAHAAQILSSGCDLYLLSTGILADEHLRDALTAVSARSGARILLPAGAMAGFDGLLAMRAQGLTRARYTSTKPPCAWRGTPAEADDRLDGLTAATIVFDGSARDAALAFPKNANLAASIAIAGMGLDDTRVTLIADPAARGNIGRLDAEGRDGTLLVEASGVAAGDNPKSSAIVGHSVLASLANRFASLSFV